MKRNNQCLYILVLTLTIQLLIASCKKERPLETDPAIIILGKWELVQLGSTYIENPTEYMEFTHDSVLVVHHRETGEKDYEKYWIDSLLYRGIDAPNGKLLTKIYEYKYLGENNRMELTLLNFFGTSNYYVYKRIN